MENVEYQHRAEDAHHPHGSRGDDEGDHRVPRALQHALHADGDAEDGLGEGHEAQDGRALRYHPRVGRKDAHHLRGEEEEQAAGNAHHDEGHDDGAAADHVQLAGVLLPQRIAGERGRGGVDAQHRDIERLFGSKGDGVRGQTDRAQRRHQPGEDHMPRRGGQARQRHGHGDAQAVLHRAAIGPEHAVARRDGGVFPHHHGDEHAAQHVGKRRGDGRAAHAQTRAGHGEGQAEDAHLPRRVDEKEVHDDVEAVHGGVGQHRRARIPRRAQHGAEDDGGGAEEHRHADDAEIGRGVGLDLFLRVEPSRERG